MKRLTAILVTLVMASGLFGCSIASIREEVTGLTVGDVERAKKKFTKVIPIDAVTCVEKTGGVIICNMNALLTGTLVNNTTDSFYLRAARFDKFYSNCVNTTDVGILIKPAGPGKSLVEVFSENSFLAEAVSIELFRLLEQK